MAVPGIKFDDGEPGFATNCFPVRGLLRNAEEDSGAWLVAHRAEQRRRFKAILCTKPRDYEEIREGRKKAEKEGVPYHAPPPVTLAAGYEDQEEDDDDDGKVLDGFFLMKHCCVEDPADLCSVNISGEGFSEVKVEDLQLFDNVAYVNASENLLTIECFRNFPILRELEMSLNGMRGLKLALGDFPNLEMLDLSFNNLSSDDILPLGLLPNLRILHLTGNGISSLPAEMSRPYHDENIDKRILRFSRLEILMLDDNKLSDLTAFATLASLMRLKHLNLSKNEIFSVPQLMIIDGRCITQDPLEPSSGRRSKRSPRGSGRKSRESQAKSRTSPARDKPKTAQSSMKDFKLELIPEGKEDAMTVSNRTNPASAQGQADLSAEEVLKYAEQQLANTAEAARDEEAAKENEKEDISVDDMNLEELDLNDLETKVADDIRREGALKEGTYTSAFAEEDSGGGGMPPPFPELCHLNLSYNKIYEEESLLAVAAWPMLSELLIHDNPLTTENSGDPPLLKRFLQDRLGIHIQRKRPGPLQKPHIEVPQKPSRKVKTKVPPIPRCNVDQLLALEAPQKPALPEATPTPTARVTQSAPGRLSPAKPLPPIPQTPPTSAREAEQAPRPESGDQFFMTQVDEPDTQSHMEPPAKESRKEQKSKEKKRRKKQRDHAGSVSSTDSSRVPSRYKGYEELLDGTEDGADADDEIPMPKDIQGNIRALKYSLNHPLVFRENVVKLDKPQKPFQPYTRSKAAQGPPRKTKDEKTTEVITNLKNRSTVVEQPLEEVLDDKPKYKKHFGDATQLLAEVQRRFNVVRENSMKEARDVRKLLHDTIRDVQTDTATAAQE